MFEVATDWKEKMIQHCRKLLIQDLKLENLMSEAAFSYAMLVHTANLG